MRGHQTDSGCGKPPVAGTKGERAPRRVTHESAVIHGHEPPTGVGGTHEKGKLLHETGCPIEFTVEQLPQLRIVHAFSDRDGHVRFSLSAFVKFGRKLRFLERFRAICRFRPSKDPRSPSEE
jgi:hypothetical protein